MSDLKAMPCFFFKRFPLMLDYKVKQYSLLQTKETLVEK